jgi:putative CocE/NonD family hydrolase
MRDGVLLASDIYRPGKADKDSDKALPVIIERTPYDKRGISRSEVNASNPEPATRVEIAEYFAGQGFAVVMQDCRGRFDSEGEFEKYVNEAEDGFDMFEWLVRQPWCNGRIGTMGLSYGAHTQCALACLDPPGLACMFMDSGGFSSAFHGGIRRGGAFELKQATWAHRHALRSALTNGDSHRLEGLQARDIADWFRDMPWTPGNSPLSAAPEFEHYLFKQWRAGTFSDYWRQPGLYAEGYYDKFPDVPTMIVGSWYDPYVLTCLTNYRELSRRHSSPTRLIMGPWTHGDRSVTWSGDVDFGSQATLDGNIADDYRRLRLNWFRRWLAGDDSIADTRPVSYFRMGGGSGRKTAGGRLDHGGQWQTSDSWPPGGCQDYYLYMHLDGALRENACDTAGCLQYRYDPKDPVPTIGGAVTSGEPVMHGGAFDQVETEAVFKYSGVPAGQALSRRRDVLVFQTEILDRALVVSGAITITLFVGSNCPDTDFTAKLIDVHPASPAYPDGYAMNITDGIFRMRYRDGWDHEAQMAEGDVYAIRIEPFATSNIFQAGHRLRIDISSSNYPHFDINPNTGAPEGHPSEPRIARNRVHLGPTHRSSVCLSICAAD